MTSSPNIVPTLSDPFAAEAETEVQQSPFDEVLAEGDRLIHRPFAGGGEKQIARQHQKERMTVWERMSVLSPKPPEILFSNWGKNLDGASVVTSILQINERPVAVYGHDFTIRHGSMDATNGRKLVRLFELAGERGIPIVGMNDSAGAYIPSGVGGLDGYAEAIKALRDVSGVVPSIMCMFGFNAGGGSYLARIGSFLVQPKNTFYGVTGPAVIRSVLGEDIAPEKLGGPGVHGLSGVSDFTVEDEVGALRAVQTILSYIPANNSVSAPFCPSSDPMDRPTAGIESLMRSVCSGPAGFNTPFDIRLILQQVCDHGDYYEMQPARAQSTVTAFGRLAGHAVGFLCSNSAFDSGQIDTHAAEKNARFIRFCNLYNLPMVFLEDTTGFLPGVEQEQLGIVQSGRWMMDSVCDLRTPRITLIIRNAFGGAYAAYNSYPVGSNLVLGLPTARVAVMGPAGTSFVYKKEMQDLRGALRHKVEVAVRERVEAGASEPEARKQSEADAKAWLRDQEKELHRRYERDFLNPKEALSLGSMSKIVSPIDVRKTLAENLDFFMRRYTPCPMGGPQREFY